MNGSNFDGFKTAVRNGVENFLGDQLARASSPMNSLLNRSAWYVVQGGHRWRAMLAIAAGLVFEGDAQARCLPVAVAVELAHAASLVLDDLPSMDDAQLRRGRPCVHLTFAASPWAVDMLPLYMVNLAYGIALGNERAPYEARVKSALIMSRTSLAMIYGQELDVTQAAVTGGALEAGLLRCYESKSAALYGAAAEAGAITCGADSSTARLFADVGHDIGLAYQFMDDVCDVVASSAESGKDSAQDAGCKVTAVDLFGVGGARERAEAYQERALQNLSSFGGAAETLREIARNASWAPA